MTTNNVLSSTVNLNCIMFKAMELDDEQNTAAAPTPNPIEDPEPLRNLVLGSEAWHAQVPPVSNV